MLLWADGFEHYGTNVAKMLDGVYAGSDQTLDTALFQGGTTSYRVDTNDAVFNADKGLRKILSSSLTKMGVMFHLYMPVLPLGNYLTVPCDFISSTGSRNSQVSCHVDNTGSLRFYRGNTYGASAGAVGTLIATTTPIITAASWNHIEIQVNIHATLGWVRVAVNGVHRFELTGLNTLADAGSIASIYHHGVYNGNGTEYRSFNIDNLIYYDFNGTAAVETDFCPTVDGGGKATNYIGELQCTYLPPNGNTAQDTWAKSTGTSAFAVVSETTPNDADYIFSSTVADLTELALADLPTQITYIRGVMVVGRMAKSDSGAAQTQFGLKSAAAITDATSRVITTVPTYWWDFINIDPNTSARWTRASLNAALLRLKRSL